MSDRFLAMLTGLVILGGIALSNLTFAESTTNKIKDTGDDMMVHAKKTARADKRKARQATGTDNLGKDAKDKGNDVKDDVSNSVKKAKRDNQ